MRASLLRRRLARRYFPAAAAPLLVLLGGALGGCRQNAPEDSVSLVLRFGGETMGTTYSVILPGGGDGAALKAAVDSLLVAINDEVSTYEPLALISRFNRGDTLGLPVVLAEAATDALQARPGAHLAANLAIAAAPVRQSGGYFDPTVGPLVEYYGFGASALDTAAVDETEVERLRSLVGFGLVGADTSADGETLRLYPRRAGVRLDLSASAKGYGVDQVGHLLHERYGARDYFVEIGGETRARGQSPRGTPWTVGVNTPDPGAGLRDMALVVAVSDRSLATSGNYRNVRVRGGRALVHTIDPLTGRPRSSTLLSATVAAGDCATADAYATACMASGERAPDVLAKAGLPACLIFGRADGGYDLRFYNGFDALVLETAE